jgi:hypothetical protein
MLHFEAFFTLETWKKKPKKSELVDPGGDPQDPPTGVKRLLKHHLLPGCICRV